MIADLKPYSAYRETGLPWLGEVPEHWKIERAKWLFAKMDRPVREEDEIVTCFRDGTVTLRKNRRLLGYTEATVENGYQGIRKGDLVIHGMDAYAGAIGVSDSDGKGIEHGALHFDLFYGTPSEGNVKALGLHALNRFSLTRQLAYSTDETRRSLDLCLFINGLPIATFELKNSLTKQTVADAVEQYQRDRDPRERLFEFGRCVVHFAVDDSEVQMCTELRGKGSWFLPFNKGYNDGAGNPPNPNGIKTDYLWKELLTPAGLTNILENYAQIVEEKDERTGRKKRRQVWPRYHQLGVVRHALADVQQFGAGKRYLIQHSAGSGKSNSIAWLAHQLIGLKREGRDVFDSVIVVTDRTILDDQLQKTIRQFMQVGATVGHARQSGDLRRFIQEGKKIIVSTVQKFPFILDEIALETGRAFAIVIDEAHSSQGGKNASAMSQALSGTNTRDAEEPDPEDTVNEALEKRMAARKMLTNASYFAFTATPKNKTLEMFGEALPPDAEGKVKHRPFHSYTMKQAIDEGFILDVLKSYTPVESYYKLIKKIEDDPEFDTKKAKKKLHRYVESHDHAIRIKTEIMVDHFHEQVLAANKIGGQARAMVITNGIERAIQYFNAFQNYLEERKSPYKAIVAFSGVHDYDEDGQVKFKGNAKAFCRSYSFLSSILPYSNAAWEKLSIFLTLLIPKLPAPVEEDFSKGILDAIDMDSYRVEKKAIQNIVLQDSNSEIEPIPMEGGGHKAEPELDRLSNILKIFNDRWSGQLQDPERQTKRIIDDIAPKVAESAAYRNARENTPHTARMVHDEALGKVMQLILKDDTQFYKLFVENESFRRELGDVVYAMTNG